MERNRGGRPRHPDVLTPAEWRVLEALREGGTNAEIAARLGVSTNTVRYHVSNMLAKLELRDRRALAAWRPETPRRRLGAVLAVPAAVWSVGRPLAWVGVGAAVLAGVVVVAVALVALEALVEPDPDPPAAVAPPPATPTATATPSPTPTPALAATPEPTPTPTTTPTPPVTPTAAPLLEPASSPASCEDIECHIQPDPDAFEHRVWEYPFGLVDWDAGTFVLHTPTGRIDGYRVNGGPEGAPTHLLPHEWVYAPGRLLNRETMQAWRWPAREADLVAVSHDYALLESDNGQDYLLLARDGEVRGPFELPGGERGKFFSPDGQVIVTVGLDAAYRTDVVSLEHELFFRAVAPRGWDEASLEPAFSGPPPVAGPFPRDHRIADHLSPPGLLLLHETYSRGSGEARESISSVHLFDWNGASRGLHEQRVCQGSRLVSPDGRYVASQQGDGHIGKRHGHDQARDPWSAVVIADARTCEPLFRVRSAYLTSGPWYGQWLSNSDGIVVGVQGGYAVARVRPRPQLIDLPRPRAAEPRSYGPVPAPTGDGRYFAYSFFDVFDAQEGDWVRTAIMSRDVQIPWGNLSFSWGETHEEVWLEGFFWDGPLLDWILLQPRIELPPFSDELSFRVAGTVDCLILRESHLAGSSAIACLPNGTRVSQGARDWPYAEDPRDWPGGLGPIYVRTDDGLEGWVATDYLEHD